MVLSEDGALLALHCQIYEAALVCVNHEGFWQLALPVLIVAALQTEKKKVANGNQDLFTCLSENSESDAIETKSKSFCEKVSASWKLKVEQLFGMTLLC